MVEKSKWENVQLLCGKLYFHYNDVTPQKQTNHTHEQWELIDEGNKEKA